MLPERGFIFYLPKSSDIAPAGINVTLFDRDNKPTTLNLNQVDRTAAEPFEATHYQGELSPIQGSYMGIQVRIPFTKGEPTVIEERNLSP